MVGVVIVTVVIVGFVVVIVVIVVVVVVIVVVVRTMHPSPWGSWSCCPARMSLLTRLTRAPYQGRGGGTPSLLEVALAFLRAKHE